MSDRMRTSGSRDLALDADLRRAGELVGSAQSILARIDGRESELPDVQRAEVQRLVDELIAAADSVDAVLLGIAMRSAERAATDATRQSPRHP